MIERIVGELGPWNWMVLGFVLLGLEIFVPGVFLVWIGLAALAIGLVSFLAWDLAFWTWQVQVLAFLAAALAAAWFGYRFYRRDATPSDEPLLNQRARQLVGRTGTLEEPIRDGRGRLKLGDTWWRVLGPDAAPGTRVRVAEVRDGELVVEPV
jgi:membrane protein implicated in regulation of membrane protease activity